MIEKSEMCPTRTFSKRINLSHSCRYFFGNERGCDRFGGQEAL
jgi:hypothetical protein